MDKIILHCDLNNFYASVEVKNHPEYKDKPVAVAGDPNKRTGIILAKNQLAKEQGVTTGEVIWMAKQHCPDLICLAPHHEEYAKISKQVHEIYLKYTDYVEPFGLDECWLDVTNSTRLFGDGITIANKIRQEVKDKIGLTISVGVSFSKMFAKLGSDLKKPDAVSIISKDNYKTVAWNLPVNAMMFVGKHRVEKLQKMNINTIGNLANFNPSILKEQFGINGIYLHQIANGCELDVVAKYDEHRQIKSIGNGTTTIKDIDNLYQAKQVIYYLSEMTSTRLREKGLECLCVTLDIKDNELHTVGKAKTIQHSTSNASEIAKVALEILSEKWNWHTDKKIRALRVKCSTLIDAGDNKQLNIFYQNDKKNNKKDESIDKIRQKYGFSSIKRGVLLNANILNIEAEDDYF